LKPFSELGPLQQRRVSQKAFDSMKEVSESRQIAPVQMAGYMMKRYVDLIPNSHKNIELFIMS
jgi:hypothetical protein